MATVRRTKRNPDDGMGLVLLGVVVTGATFAAILFFAKKAAAGPAVTPGTPVPTPQNVVLFPDLKVGDVVTVDTVKGNIPPPSNGTPLLACVVDMLVTDPVFISVRALTAPFAGTITRDAIVRVQSAADGLQV